MTQNEKTIQDIQFKLDENEISHQNELEMTKMEKEQQLAKLKSDLESEFSQKLASKDILLKNKEHQIIATKVELETSEFKLGRKLSKISDLEQSLINSKLQQEKYLEIIQQYKEEFGKMTEL